MATGEFGKFVSRVKQSAISVAGELTPVLKVYIIIFSYHFNVYYYH